jgi:hypothetical protein
VDHQQFLFFYISGAVSFGFLFWRIKKNIAKGPSRLKNKTPHNLDSSTSKPITKKVIFMYNGYAWNAYEVLALSPGASIDEIKNAFNKAIKKEDSSTHDFLKTALEALLVDIRDNKN